jgi:hypothetical protein
MSDWIFPQEKSNFPKTDSDIPMLILVWTNTGPTSGVKPDAGGWSDVGGVNMTLVTRRHFVRQAAFAAALSRCPVNAIGEARQFFDAYEQNHSPLDAAAIRQLNPGIAGRVITPDAPEYETSRSIFNRAFDLHPAVIVRCAGPSDVARALDFAQVRKLPLAVHGGGLLCPMFCTSGLLV